VENVQPSSLVNLLSTIAAEESGESWSKTGDKQVDDANESKFGPILAEDRFTIIDLLQHMGLQDLANFYRRRLHPVLGGRVNPSPSPS
jgi:hypothetical protein